MPVLYMGYLAHYTLLLRKHKGLIQAYTSLTSTLKVPEIQ